MPFLERPVVGSLGAVMLWLILRGILPDLKEDENIVRTTIGTLTTMWVFLTGAVLVKAWSKWSTVDNAVGIDFEVFRKNKDQRILITGFATALYIISGLFIGSFFLLKFTYVLTAVCAIGGVSFVVMTCIEIIKDLDDPFTGLWNIRELPDDWKEKLKQLEIREN